MSLNNPAVRLAIAIVVAGLLMLAAALSHARDRGQWDKQDPAIAHWFESLMQPDIPDASCCGEADAYWADSYAVGPHGEYIAIVTDTRTDAPLARPHVDVGTRIIVPPNKIKFDRGNPTGHGIIFTNAAGTVFCYLPPGGV